MTDTNEVPKTNRHYAFVAAPLLVAALAVLAACGSDESGATADDSTTDVAVGGTGAFQAEVWADNWFALYVNGELVGEDSVPITTERSFNAETISFDATYPLTIAIEAKDYIETDSGLEYIGENNQQMGDGGIIAQITDTSTGEIVAVTDADWATYVIHKAPLNTECENAGDPDTDCQFEIVDAPSGWTEVGFDTADWAPASVWSEADVDPKMGYDEISWDGSAQLVWGSDLEVDNTVLMVTTIDG